MGTTSGMVDTIFPREGEGQRDSVTLSKYDVFLSHRGPDVKKTFVSHLYKALHVAGCEPFSHAKSLVKGESAFNSINEALSGVRVHVAILSKRYAESKYCLNELCDMLASQKPLILVFYNVEPENLRWTEVGPFAEAFLKHMEKGRDADVMRWKAALSEAADIVDITGFRLVDCDNDTMKLEQKIVGAVLNALPTAPPLAPARHPVGLKESAEKVMDMLHKMGDDVGVIGICGMGGIGKTTLAKEVFNCEHAKFGSWSFLRDVKEAKGVGVMDLQMKMVSDLLRVDGKKMYWDAVHWFDRIRKLKQKVFIVIDDISKRQQFDELIPDVKDLPFGSRVLITSRERYVLRDIMLDAPQSALYDVLELSFPTSVELFLWCAFRKSNIDDVDVAFHGFIKDITRVCGGLPLALEVMGGFFSDKMNLLIHKRFWQEAILALQKDGQVMTSLQLSYDNLVEDERLMFLDIACFLLGHPERVAIEVWDSIESNESSSWLLSRLIDKNLVKVVDSMLSMHDLLRDMGRNVVLKKVLGRLELQSHIWDSSIAIKVLQKKQGCDEVLALTAIGEESGTSCKAELYARTRELKYLSALSDLRELDLSGCNKKYQKLLPSDPNIVKLPIASTIDVDMEDAANHNQSDTRGGTMQGGMWNDCIVERCSDPEFMHTLKKKMEAMTWIQNIDIEEAFSEGNCCDQSTIVLGTFNVATDNLEFYFESGESMAKLVGVGLSYGKVIVKRGIIFEVQELEPNDWKKVQLEVKECSDESFTIMKVTRPTRALSELLQDGGHIASSSSSSSTKQGFKGVTFAASNSVLEVPCIWELAKFFIMKQVNDVFQNGCNADASRKSSGTNSKEDCPRDGNETVMNWAQTLKVLWSRGTRGEDDNNGNKNQDEDQGGGSDRGNGDGNGGDDDDSTGGKSKVDDEEEYFTVVNVYLLGGGDCFETRNMKPLSRERLKKAKITPELTFGFCKSRKSKTIQVTTRVLFAIDRDYDSIDTCGHFGWFHDVLHVSFGPFDRNIQRNVYLKIDFKEIESISGKTTTTASVARDTGKGEVKGYQGRLAVGSSQVAQLQLGVNTNQEETSVDHRSNEQCLESQINQTTGGFRIKAFPVVEEALLEYEYSAPFFEVCADQIQNRRYRHELNSHPMCAQQKTAFVGTWIPIRSNEVVEYILKADRRLYEISARIEEQSASTSSGTTAFFQELPKPEVRVSSVLERPVTQVYEKQLFVNHAMAHLINGQTYTLFEGSMPENPYQDLDAPLVTFPVLVDYQ